MSAERPPTGSHRPAGTTPTAPTEPAPDPVDNANRIRGLQAWMADVDRRLAIRTKLILILAAIAIGGAGAAIFLAVEANRTSASQEQLNELEAEVELLEEQIETLAEAVTRTREAARDALREANEADQDAEPGGEDAAIGEIGADRVAPD